MGGSHVFIIEGTVSLETLKAVEGTKQVRSEIQNLSKSGIAGFEAAQQKVIELTKRIGELRTQLLQTNDPAAQAKLNTALAQSQKEFSAARGSLRGMSLESREANEKVQMLAASLGVRIPYGLERILARLPFLQAAMSAAFGVGIIVAVGAAIVAVIPKLDDWMDKLRGIEKVSADVYTEVGKLNIALGALGPPDSAKAMRVEIRNVAGEIGRVVEHLKRLQELQAGPEKGAFSPAMWYINRKEVNLLNDRLGNLTKRYEELGSAIPTTEVKEHNKAMEEGGRAAKKLAEKIARVKEELWKILHKEAPLAYERKFTLIEPGVAEKNAKEVLDIMAQMDQARLGANLSTLSEIEKAEAEAALAVIKINQDESAALLANEFAKEDRRTQIVTIASEARGALERQAAAAIARLNKEKAEKLLQEQEKLAQSIESFIDRVFLTARSLSDVFHQFLMQSLSSFVKWVSHMLADWWKGVREATGQQQSGGILGSLLGALFGIGGAAAPATASGITAGAGAGVTAQSLTTGIESMFGNSATALAGGSALTAVTGGMPAAAGGVTTAAAGGLAQLGALLPTTAIMGGVNLMTAGGPVTSGIGGYLAGVGATALLGALGPATFGITWAAAAIGAAIGAWRRGRQKEKASALEQTFELAANELYDQFKKFKIDYESALSGMQGLITEGQQTLTSSGYGRWGRQGAQNLASVIQQEIEALKSLQKQREARAGIMAGMTVPEFHSGGLVLGPGGWGLKHDEVLAVLQRGESVLNRSATAALGAEMVNALNRTPRFHEGGSVGASRVTLPGQKIEVHFHVSAIDAQSVETFFRRNQGRIVKSFRRAVADGAL
jgi:hypothetical protein